LSSRCESGGSHRRTVAFAPANVHILQFSTSIGRMFDSQTAAGGMFGEVFRVLHTREQQGNEALLSRCLAYPMVLNVILPIDGSYGARTRSVVANTV
jgi:hypothetical protein